MFIVLLTRYHWENIKCDSFLTFSGIHTVRLVPELISVIETFSTIDIKIVIVCYIFRINLDEKLLVKYLYRVLILWTFFLYVTERDINKYIDIYIYKGACFSVCV